MLFMKWKWLFCLLYLFISCVSAFSSQPQLVCPSLTHDFGKVWEGTPLVHSFILKNTGDAPLIIQSVKPG